MKIIRNNDFLFPDLNNTEILFLIIGLLDKDYLLLDL